MFKKKDPGHSEKVSAAYRCYTPDEATMFFPGGIHQADQIICSLAKIYGFHLDPLLELEIYGKLFGEGKTVSWLSGDLYLNQYQKGYQPVEQGKFTEAIKALKASLGLNPIGISARFELCECFIQSKDLPSAKQVLEDMSAYLLAPKHIARFYRRMGYIEIENCNYLVAVACYIYSRSFEDHPTIEQELQYIYQEVGVHVNGVLNDPTTILKKCGIPVLKERNIDDIQVPNS